MGKLPLSTYGGKCISESYITTYGQLVSLSCNITPIWGLRPDFYYRQTVEGFLLWSALSDERTGLSFIISTGTRHRRHPRVGVPVGLNSIKSKFSSIYKICMILEPTILKTIDSFTTRPPGSIKNTVSNSNIRSYVCADICLKDL
jgi:hypothetical protein